MEKKQYSKTKSLTYGWKTVNNDICYSTYYNLFKLIPSTLCYEVMNVDCLQSN